MREELVSRGIGLVIVEELRAEGEFRMAVEMRGGVVVWSGWGAEEEVVAKALRA